GMPSEYRNGAGLRYQPTIKISGAGIIGDSDSRNRAIERVFKLMRQGRGSRLLVFYGMAASLCCWTACGGGTPSSSSTTKATSGVKNRALISVDSVSFGGAVGDVAIFDATADAPSSVALSIGLAPGHMVLSADKSKTLVIDPRQHAVITIDNKAESLLATLSIGEVPTSAVLLPDNPTGYVAVRNLGQVLDFDINKGTTTATISGLNEVRTLVLGHDGQTLLAFSDDSNVVNVIDAA